MSPSLALPSVPHHAPRFPKSSDFIALDCPQFGYSIGDRVPCMLLDAPRIGDSFGDVGLAPKSQYK